MKAARITALVSAIAILAGCEQNTDPLYTAFFRPAGDIADTGRFGQATQNNIGVQSGDQRFTLDLANRFAAEVPSTVNFSFNSAQLDEGARDALRSQADWIRQFPEVRFKVFGHADAVGSNAYNKRLGLRRANAVVNYLASQGIERSRLEAVVSFGETQPLIVTDGRERRNRRTVTEVSGFVNSSRLVTDGKYAQIVYRDYIESAAMTSELRNFEDDLIEEQAQ